MVDRNDRQLPDDAKMIPSRAKRVFSGEIFDVYQWPQVLYDGSMATFEMLRRPDTVIVIGIRDDDDIIACNEEQPGGIVRRDSLPAGRVDGGDVSVLEAAKRELREETGYRFSRWKLLQVTQPEKKIEWFVHVFVAWQEQERVAPHLDAGEKIDVTYISFEELKQRYAAKIPALLNIDSLSNLKEK